MQAAITRVGMPLDEFLERATHERFELINGERRPKVPASFMHSYILDLLLTAVKAYLAVQRIGVAYAETAFVLPDRQDANWVKGSRIPDLLYITQARFAQFLRETPNLDTIPLLLVPDLVAEVVSTHDRYSDIGDKVQLYLRDGVRLVWVIDPQQRNISIHTAGQPNPVVLRGEDATLDGGDVLPGFALPLAELFRTPEEHKE